jgi:ribosomal protein S18 acetylase RimI-like enzyme
MRAAEPKDAATLAALIRLSFAAQDVRTDPPPSALHETADSVRRLLAVGGGIITGDPPIAGLIWSEVEGALYVGRLAVHPNHRRAGLARRLLAAAEEVARSRALNGITLSTRLVLGSNRRLFASCGFIEGSTHSHPGYDRPTFVEMMKPVIPISKAEENACSVTSRLGPTTS